MYAKPSLSHTIVCDNGYACPGSTQRTVYKIITFLLLSSHLFTFLLMYLSISLPFLTFLIPFLMYISIFPSFSTFPSILVCACLSCSYPTFSPFLSVSVQVLGWCTMPTGCKRYVVSLAILLCHILPVLL